MSVNGIARVFASWLVAAVLVVLGSVIAIYFSVLIAQESNNPIVFALMLGVSQLVSLLIAVFLGGAVFRHLLARLRPDIVFAKRVPYLTMGSTVVPPLYIGAYFAGLGVGLAASVFLGLVTALLVESSTRVVEEESEFTPSNN